jgi:thiamine biosynthesis lipoprotein
MSLVALDPGARVQRRLGEVGFPVWGMTAVLLVTDPAALSAARALLEAELADVSAACNRFRPDSELSALNASAGGPPVIVGELLAQALAVALRAARCSGGAVDPTVGRALLELGYDRDIAAVQAADRWPARTRSAPHRAPTPVPGWRAVRFDPTRRAVALPAGLSLDLGATAKAFTADRAARAIAEACTCGVLVALGGDISVAGPPPPGGWSVRVTDDHAGPLNAPGQTVALTGVGWPPRV